MVVLVTKYYDASTLFITLVLIGVFKLVIESREKERRRNNNLGHPSLPLSFPLIGVGIGRYDSGTGSQERLPRTTDRWVVLTR